MPCRRRSRGDDRGPTGTRACQRSPARRTTEAPRPARSRSSRSSGRRRSSRTSVGVIDVSPSGIAPGRPPRTKALARSRPSNAIPCPSASVISTVGVPPLYVRPLTSPTTLASGRRYPSCRRPQRRAGRRPPLAELRRRPPVDRVRHDDTARLVGDHVDVREGGACALTTWRKIATAVTSSTTELRTPRPRRRPGSVSWT